MRVSDNGTSPETPIAIVGMGCLLPGANSPEEFWSGLLAGADQRSSGGRDIFGTDPTVPGGWGDEQHHITATRGGFVSEPEIDLSGLRVRAEELADLGRVVRWPVHVIRQALEDAGLDLGVRFERTGLVLGNYSFPTERSVDLCVPLARDAVSEGLRTGGFPLPPGGRGGAEITPANLWPFGLPGTVVGNAFGFGGPRLTLDAACASALYGMALAQEYLSTGRADVMVAGAVCAPDPLLIHLSFSDLRAYPTNGISQPFHEDSTGIVTGQGAGVLVLKRLADAERDGDRIHAVLESVGLANDGSGAHLLTPNLKGQLDAYRSAYGTSVDPSAVDYLECHATGTPLGDSVELQGIAEFFGDDAPLLGSVKGNVGHLLTVAGFTSVLKVLLAMRHGVIPATPGVSVPRSPRGAEHLVQRIVKAEQVWPDRPEQQRWVGAVSSFGFGGTNAHAVLTSAPPPVPASRAGDGLKPASRPVVTGVGVRLGQIGSPSELESAVHIAEPVLGELPEERWDGIEELIDPARGGYVNAVDVDALTYRLPPADLGGSNPQHLVLFQAVDQALADAGFDTQEAASHERRRIAVVVAMEMEPRSHRHRARFDIGVHVREECARAGVQLTDAQLDKLESAVRDSMHEPLGANEVLSWIGNIMASRISASRDLTGPAFTIAADVTAGARALEVAELLLLDTSIEAVLVGGVDLAGGVENRLARIALAAEREVEVPDLGDGAAALVLRRGEDLGSGQRSYGSVAGVSIRYGVNALAEAAHQCGLEAGIDKSAVDYVELATPAEPGSFAALASAFRATDQEGARCALGSLVPLIGDTQHASVIASLAKTLLCMNRAELPPAPPALTSAARDVPDLKNSDLYLPAEPVPWLASNAEHRRIGAVVTVGADSGSQVLVTNTEPDHAPTRWSESPGPLLLPLQGDDADGLVDAAWKCLDDLEMGRDSLALIRERVREPRTGRLTAVLVAGDAEELRRELHAAVRALPETVASGAEWATPSGSYCTARPLGPDQKVAFVYPGAFTTYPGAGRELFRLFPVLRAEFERSADVPAARFKHRRLYPRTTGGPDRKMLMRHEAAMVEDVPAMLAIGTNFAVLHTNLLRDVLGVPLHGGFGYSLGESSMMFATGVWSESTRDDVALSESSLFRDQLRGPKELVRKAWGLSPTEPDAVVWVTRVLLTGADDVRAALEAFDRVYLTHVNGPAEVVVAGDPVQCRELITRLGCLSVPAPANHVMHCPLVDPVLPDLAMLNSYPLGTPSAGLELLSAYDYDRVEISDRERLAERIAWTLRSTIDFARLTRTAHDRGFRYFVEVGVGATCSRWIRDTLAEREHVAVSVDRRGASTGAVLAQALAKLVSHGLPVRLDQLYPQEPEPQARRSVVPVTCGGESIVQRVRTAAETLMDELRQTDSPSAELIAGGNEPTAFCDEWIAIEREPFVDFSGAPKPTSARTVGVDRPRPAHPPVPASNVLGGGRGSLHDLIRTAAEAHRTVLRTHDAMQDLDLRRLESGGSAVSLDSLGTSSAPEPVTKNVIWNQDDLLEFATGRVANVFGPEFAAIDRHAVRVRLPEPPYLFVSRVTELHASVGRFEPCSITTEYDIPYDAWYLLDGSVPCAVTIEAGQCDLLLISYLGIDFRNQGSRVYRLLDSRLVFHGDLPRAGQTLRYDIKIDRFVWNGDSLLFFFSYKCYADNALILELVDACAGFFSPEELDGAQGIVLTEADRKRREQVTASWFTPLARTGRTRLTAEDLRLLASGRLAEVFGNEWDQTADACNSSIRLPGEMLRMIDEVTSIDRLGGPRGLGEMNAIKHLDPDAWYFRCHFTGDPVLAGSLVAEGAVQLLQTYAMYLGLHLVLPDAEFQPVRDQTTQVKVRGQITPLTSKIRYSVEITEITMLPRPTVIADIVVFDDEKPVISMHQFGLQIREKPGTPHRAGPGGVAPFLGRRNHSGEVAFLNELHMAHAAKGDLATAMGPEFEIYANRRAPYIPNGDFRFVDRIMRLHGTRGRLEPGAHMETEYDCPLEAWYFREGYRGVPNFVHMESSLQAAILLGYYLGATLSNPSEEFSIRNLDGKAALVADVDLRGKTVRHSSTMLSSQSISGAVLQSFRYELSVDGEVFYRGESLFGYFTEQALANQVGLDSGEHVAHWIDEQPDLAHEKVRALRSLAGTERDERLRLFDEADAVLDGGVYGLGYVCGRRRIEPEDWYFERHFHRDPVMPGSLGVEAVIHALQGFAVEAGLVEGLRTPVFAAPCDVETGWRYRGQVLRSDREMSFELHVKKISGDADRILLIADGSVWKHAAEGGGASRSGLRIYELTDVAVEVRDHSARPAAGSEEGVR